MSLEIDVFDSDADTLEQPQPRTVEQGSHQPRCAVVVRKEPGDLPSRQYSWQPLGAPSRGRCLDRIEVNSKHFRVQEEDGSEGLILGGRARAMLGGEVGQEGRHVARPELSGMATVMKQDEAGVGVRLATPGNHWDDVFQCPSSEEEET